MQESNILGGINSIPGGTSILQVSGGFTLKSEHIENRVLIGNLAKTYIKNRILEWTTFQETYYKKGKLSSDKDYKNLLCVLNDIFPLPIYTINEDELLFLIKHIYTASPTEIMTALTKSTPLQAPLQASIRHLFMTYKIYIEQSIELFVHLRQDYMKKRNLLKSANSNEFMKLVDRWNSVDMENKVNTSSLILFFNFPPTSAKLEKTVPQINWNIPGATILVNKSITAFLAAAKKHKFSYGGFCPHAAIERFNLLLRFPIKELLVAINAIDFNKKYSDINDKCNTIIPKVVALQHKARDLHKAPEIKLSDRKLSKKLDISKFAKSASVADKTHVFEEYIKLFMKLYKEIAPYLVEKEKKINNLAMGINVVAKDLQSLADSYAS